MVNTARPHPDRQVSELGGGGGTLTTDRAAGTHRGRGHEPLVGLLRCLRNDQVIEPRRHADARGAGQTFVHQVRQQGRGARPYPAGAHGVELPSSGGRPERQADALRCPALTWGFLIATDTATATGGRPRPRTCGQWWKTGGGEGGGRGEGPPMPGGGGRGA